MSKMSNVLDSFQLLPNTIECCDAYLNNLDSFRFKNLRIISYMAHEFIFRNSKLARCSTI